jgi:hypothetical protein
VDLSVEIAEDAPVQVRALNDVTLAELLKLIYDGRPFERDVSLAWVDASMYFEQDSVVRIARIPRYVLLTLTFTHKRSDNTQLVQKITKNRWTPLEQS